MKQLRDCALAILLLHASAVNCSALVRAATPDELQLAETVRQFFQVWLADRDPKAATAFVAQQAFVAICDSDPDDDEKRSQSEVVGEYETAFQDALDNLVPQKPLDELIKAAEPGLPNEDYISHPWNTLFDLAHFASGGSMKGMICKGRDRRPFVVEALSRPGLYLVFVELQVDRELLEEIRRKSENPEAVVELVFIWTREGSAWKMLTLDLIRR